MLSQSLHLIHRGCARLTLASFLQAGEMEMNLAQFASEKDGTESASLPWEFPGLTRPPNGSI